MQSLEVLANGAVAQLLRRAACPFRSSTNEALDKENKDLATIKYPFTVDYFGGWDKAYPEVIEGTFRDQVQQKK